MGTQISLNMWRTASLRMIQVPSSVIHFFEKSHCEGQKDCGVIGHCTVKQTLTGDSKIQMMMDDDNEEDA